MVVTKINRGGMLVGVILVGLLFFTACSGTVNTAPSTLSKPEMEVGGNVVEVNVQAFQFGFKPETIRVKKGDLVRLTAESIDVPHGLAIDTFGVRLYLDGLQPQTVEFVADKVGTFKMYCTVACGVGHSKMVGTFIVEE